VQGDSHLGHLFPNGHSDRGGRLLLDTGAASLLFDPGGARSILLKCLSRRRR
jgi:peptide methionine sulfoxide reductase MsrB